MIISINHHSYQIYSTLTSGAGSFAFALYAYLKFDFFRIDDLIEDGAQVSNIVNAALSSSDTNYNGINPPDLTVATTDDDVYELTLNPVAGLAVDESGNLYGWGSNATVQLSH